MFIIEADHDSRRWVDIALDHIGDPGLIADVHRYRNLEKEHRQNLELINRHLLQTPKQRHLYTMVELKNDQRLVMRRLSISSVRLEVEERLWATALPSRITPILDQLLTRCYA